MLIPAFSTNAMLSVTAWGLVYITDLHYIDFFCNITLYLISPKETGEAFFSCTQDITVHDCVCSIPRTVLGSYTIIAAPEEAFDTCTETHTLHA